MQTESTFMTIQFISIFLNLVVKTDLQISDILLFISSFMYSLYIGLTRYLVLFLDLLSIFWTKYRHKNFNENVFDADLQH